MLLFTEGFDWTLTQSDLITYNKWLDRNGVACGNTGGNLRFGTGSGNYLTYSVRTNFLRRALGSNLAAGCIGFAVMHTTAASYKGCLMTLYDTTSNVQMGLMLNADGTLSVYRSTGATILGTSSFAITGNVWYYIEFKWKIANSISSGDVEVYVDDTNVLTVAAASDTQNTANAYATHFQIAGNDPGSSGSGNVYYDDIYVIDFSGSVNNARLGPMRIQTLLPSGNGNTSNFTGSDGNSVNNYQQVDDVSLGVSDYNDGASVGDKDTYAFADSLSTTSTIKALTINYVAAKTDASARGVKPVVRHSSTDYDGTEDTLATNALHYQHVYETNPGTSSGWTKSDIDNAEFGMKVST